jgi:hypothetical protein
MFENKSSSEVYLPYSSLFIAEQEQQRRDDGDCSCPAAAALFCRVNAVVFLVV